MVTVKEARKILGKSSKKLSDMEVQSMVDLLYGICEDAVEKTIQIRLERDKNTVLKLRNKLI